MTAKLEVKSKEHKEDLINLLILISIAAVLGIYLISTSVLIAQDGVFYIEQSRDFQSNPLDVIRSHLPGYPFLIFLAHKIITLFSNSSSIHMWIYSAQGIVLLCRVLSFIVLYFIGKILVGQRDSFLALLILIFLPYPAEFGSDVLRDWPHILFLAISFLFLLAGAKHKKWWMFAIVGLSAGLGQTIRPECGQVVIYGVLWLIISLLSRKSTIEKSKIALLLLSLLVSFAIITVPYMKIRGRILPAQLEDLVSSIQVTDELSQIPTDESVIFFAGTSVPVKVFDAGTELLKNIMENLMYIFFPFLLFGIYFFFRQKDQSSGKFFISVFLLFNILLLILLFCDRGYMSRRHCLPLVVFSVFYIPSGLKILSNRITLKLPEFRHGSDNSQSWFFVLLSIGIIICLPKLLRPIRLEKKVFRTCSQWIEKNTKKDDKIYVADRRIGLYAQREMPEYAGEEVPDNIKYFVKTFKTPEEMRQYTEEIEGKFSILNRWDSKKKTIVFYGLKTL